MSGSIADMIRRIEEEKRRRDAALSGVMKSKKAFLAKGKLWKANRKEDVPRLSGAAAVLAGLGESAASVGKLDGAVGISLHKAVALQSAHSAVDRQVSGMVRHLHNLGHDPARYPETIMHIQFGTGTAKPRKLDWSNIKALGYVTAAINP